MGAQAQAPERTMAAVGGASLATIESLRARLLAERAASKEARENAQKIALKVSELQSRLDAEIEQRKKAELAMNEVLEVLQAKGVVLDELMMAVTSTTVSSESEEAAQPSSSKDAESEHSSGEEAFQIHCDFNQQDSGAEAPHLKSIRFQSEAGIKHEDSVSDEMQIMAEDALKKRDALELENVLAPCVSGEVQIMTEDALKRDALEMENVLAPEDKFSLRTDKYDESKEGVADDELIKHEQDVFMAEDASKRNGLDLENVVAAEDKIMLRTEKSDELIEGMSENEEHIKYEQDVLIDDLDGPPHASQGESKIRRPSESFDHCSQDQFVGQAVFLNRLGPNLQSAKGSLSEYLEKAAIPYQVAKPSFGTIVDWSSEQSFAFDRRQSLHASAGDNDILKWLPPEASATAVGLIPSRLDGGSYGDERVHAAEEKSLRGLLPRDMAPLVRESTLGIGPNYIHPTDLSRGTYLYERLYPSFDPQHVHHVSQAEAPAPFTRGPKRPAYVTEFTRFPPQVGMRNDILSLVDDKSGKLGNILMALNLAKQQIHDEDYTAAYMEEPLEATAAPGPFRGKPYPDLYEGVPHKPLTCQWRFEPQTQIPIVHFPISPRADHEPSPFEAHDRVKLDSTSAYYVPGYDPYPQPKGELHLGNGITLYTD